MITKAFDKCMTVSNIQSGFRKCGIWDLVVLGTDIEPLKYLFVDQENSSEQSPTIDELKWSFLNRSRSLLRDADVEESGTIRICTSTGVHLTS